MTIVITMMMIIAFSAGWGGTDEQPGRIGAENCPTMCPTSTTTKSSMKTLSWWGVQMFIGFPSYAHFPTGEPLGRPEGHSREYETLFWVQVESLINLAFLPHLTLMVTLTSITRPVKDNYLNAVQLRGNEKTWTRKRLWKLHRLSGFRMAGRNLEALQRNCPRTCKQVSAHSFSHRLSSPCPPLTPTLPLAHPPVGDAAPRMQFGEASRPGGNSTRTFSNDSVVSLIGWKHCAFLIGSTFWEKNARKSTRRCARFTCTDCRDCWDWEKNPEISHTLIRWDI